MIEISAAGIVIVPPVEADETGVETTTGAPMKVSQLKSTW